MLLEPTRLSLLIGGLLVLALLVYGLRDLARFSMVRVWAIRGVVFRESVRRRVLWVTPLAMLGVLLLIGLQDPVDEADEIRQATRSCLFASGLVAIVISLILACTNLPREIANRVIFTIASKPVTRFELLVGKVFGFAQLSALVLLIMGGFTLVLLWIMNAALVHRIETSLQTTLPVETRRPYLQYLASQGLLQAQHIDNGDDLQVYAEPPQDPSDTSALPRYYLAEKYYAAVPFVIPPELREAVEQNPGITMLLRVRMHWKLASPDTLLPGDPPLGIVNLETLPEPPPPFVSVQLLDAEMNTVVGLSQIARNQVQLPADPATPWDQLPLVQLDPDQTLAVTRTARAGGLVYVIIYGLNAEYYFGVTSNPVQAILVDERGGELAILAPAVSDKPRQDILLRTYLGTRGVGLSGPEDYLPAPVGIFAFRDTPAIAAADDDHVEFELRMISERVGGVLDESDDTRLEATVHNLRSGYTSPPITLFPETGFPTVLRVPQEAVAGGDFDLRLQTQSRGHIVSVRGADMKLIVGRQPIALNLAKCLLVLWLLSLLVIVAGLSFSTFVSWPIAATMATFGLLGRWVARQLGEPNESWGRQVAEGIFGSSAEAAPKEVVRVGVNALGDFFGMVTAFLPDVAVYGVVGQLERGLALDWQQIWGAAVVSFGFSLPMLSLAYIVLRNKEVAP